MVGSSTTPAGVAVGAQLRAIVADVAGLPLFAVSLAALSCAGGTGAVAVADGAPVNLATLPSPASGTVPPAPPAVARARRIADASLALPLNAYLLVTHVPPFAAALAPSRLLGSNWSSSAAATAAASQSGVVGATARLALLAALCTDPDVSARYPLLAGAAAGLGTRWAAAVADSSGGGLPAVKPTCVPAPLAPSPLPAAGSRDAAAAAAGVTLPASSPTSTVPSVGALRGLAPWVLPVAVAGCALLLLACAACAVALMLRARKRQRAGGGGRSASAEGLAASKRAPSGERGALRAGVSGGGSAAPPPRSRSPARTPSAPPPMRGAASAIALSVLDSEQRVARAGARSKSPLEVTWPQLPSKDHRRRALPLAAPAGSAPPADPTPPAPRSDSRSRRSASAASQPPPSPRQSAEASNTVENPLLAVRRAAVRVSTAISAPAARGASQLRTAAAAAGGAEELPLGWAVKQSKGSGRTYFVHRASGKSQWTRPTAGDAGVRPAAGGSGDDAKHLIDNPMMLLPSEQRSRSAPSRRVALPPLHLRTCGDGAQWAAHTQPFRVAAAAGLVGHSS